MKAILFLFFLSTSLLAAERQVLMVSDSRGNCAFAHQMMRHFYSLEKTSFRLVSVGGSSPASWLKTSNRFVSPYGHDTRGNSDSVPSPFPAAIKLGKIRTPFFPVLLKEEVSEKENHTTIINMGTNTSDMKALKADAIKMIKAVHSQGSSCVWVTPPHAQGFPLKLIQSQTQAILEAAEEAGPGPRGERCRIINSLELTHYPYTHRARGIDGVHYCWDKQLIELGHDWADRAFEQIAF